jgi:tetratricopeptide (TPR) repeat protein
MFAAPSTEKVTSSGRHRTQKWARPERRRVPFCLILFSLLLSPALYCPARVVAEDAPSTFDDLAARAAAARNQQNVALAIELYGQAEHLKPDWPEGWWYLGLLNYGANNFSAAIDAFSQLIQLQPEAGPATALRGLCEFETGAYDDSLRDIEHGLALGAAGQPRNEQILRYHLAQLLTRAGRFEDALKAYAFFADRHISAPEMLVGLGMAGLRVQALPKDAAPEQRDLYLAAGESGYAFMEADSDDSAQMFSQLFARYPTTANLHMFYGYLLYPHDPDLAVEEFQREVAISPNNTPARAILAFTLMLQGRYSDAVPQAERALTEAPGMEIAELALGRSLGETGDTKRGVDVIEQVLRLDPNNMEAHIALVAIYSREGKREDARRERMVCLELAK